MSIFFLELKLKRSFFLDDRLMFFSFLHDKLIVVGGEGAVLATDNSCRFWGRGRGRVSPETFYGYPRNSILPPPPSKTHCKVPGNMLQCLRNS